MCIIHVYKSLTIFVILQILYFMKGFKDDEKRKLAIITGMLLGNSFCSAKVLSSLFEEHLVKDGELLVWSVGGCHTMNVHKRNFISHVRFAVKNSVKLYINSNVIVMNDGCSSLGESVFLVSLCVRLLSG